MELNGYVEALQRQLAIAAAAGGPEAEAIAERLAAPLDAAVRLTVQQAIVDATAEITLALAPASVDVRLAGQGLAFVVSDGVAAASPMTSPVAATGVPDSSDEGGTSRITFRPSDRLKGDIEAAAEREGLSVNAFLVRALTLLLRSTPDSGAARPQAHGQTPAAGGQRLSGWVR